MSEKNLENLIATLKTEAIETAEKEAQAIIKAAQEEAHGILTDAREEKKHLLHTAEKEAKVSIEKGESALRQAARDVRLSLQIELLQLLKAVLENEVEAKFNPELLNTAIVKVIENIGSNLELKISTELEESLAIYIQQHLQTSDKLAEITIDNSVLKGLRITKKDEGWSYDISPEAIAQVLDKHLSVKWVKLFETEE